MKTEKKYINLSQWMKVKTTKDMVDHAKKKSNMVGSVTLWMKS